MEENIDDNIMVCYNIFFYIKKKIYTYSKK